MKKSVKIIILIIASLILTWYVFGFIMTFGHQREPLISVPHELKILEEEIRKETKDGGAFFLPITKQSYNACNAKLQLYLFMYNDSIISSKNGVDGYLSQLSEKVNTELKDKKCIDSLIIRLSIKNKVDHKGKLIRKFIAFPIK